MKYIAIGGLLVGGIAFAIGFFGPIIWAPEANQGPLLGIFITGPMGFVAGCVGGAIYWFMKKSRQSRELRSAADKTDAGI